MKVFLKRTHISCIVGALLVAAYVWTMMRWYVPRIQTSEVINFLIRWALTIASFVGSYKYLNTFGLYIVDDSIYFKTFRKKKINPEEILAVKIARTVITFSRTGEGINLIDKKGDQLYSMFFVKGSLDEVDLAEDLKSDISDNWFGMFNEKNIICRCIYDQSVIDYLLTLNPNIIVF